MSIDYTITKNIPIKELKRLENYEGIKVEIHPVIDGVIEEQILFSSKDFDSENTNYLHGYINEDNTINHVCRYGGNNPERIIQCIEDEFDTHCIDEYQTERLNRFYKKSNPEEYYNNELYFLLIDNYDSDKVVKDLLSEITTDLKSFIREKKKLLDIGYSLSFLDEIQNFYFNKETV